MVEHFEKIDAVEARCRRSCVAPQLIAAKINHAPRPPRLNSAVWRVCGAPDEVLNRHPQRRVVVFDLHRLDDDQIAEPLLQRA